MIDSPVCEGYARIKKLDRPHGSHTPLVYTHLTDGQRGTKLMDNHAYQFSLVFLL
jgi:hypothetical protein